MMPLLNFDRSVESEQSVQLVIHNIVSAISLEVSDNIDLTQKRRILGVECDILLLYRKNRIPFAVLEIKRTARTSLYGPSLRTIKAQKKIEG